MTLASKRAAAPGISPSSLTSRWEEAPTERMEAVSPPVVRDCASKPLQATPRDSQPAAKHLLALQSRCTGIIIHYGVSPGSCTQRSGCKTCCHPQGIPRRCLSPSFSTEGMVQRPCGTQQHPPEPTAPRNEPDFQKDVCVQLPPGQPAGEPTHVRLCLVLFYHARRTHFTLPSEEKTRSVPFQPNLPQAAT